MGIDAKHTGHMSRRALLTDREREVIRGDADDVQDLEQYQSKIRTRLTARIDRLVADLDLLEEHEPEIAATIGDEICPGGELEQLQTEVSRLQSEIDDLRD